MDGMSYDMEEKALIIIASNTGNTSTFLPFLEQYCSRSISVDMRLAVTPDLYSCIAIGTYTWGNGKIPKRLKDYLIKHHKSLSEKRIFIFGSGNSVYPNFCGAVDGIEKICRDSNASIHGMHKFEQRFNESNLEESEKTQLIRMIEEWSA